METDKGTRIKLDASFNPAGCLRGEDGGVWLALFDPRPKDQPNQTRQNAGQNAPRAQQSPQFDNFDDDIPF